MKITTGADEVVIKKMRNEFSWGKTRRAARSSLQFHGSARHPLTDSKRADVFPFQVELLREHHKHAGAPSFKDAVRVVEE